MRLLALLAIALLAGCASPTVDPAPAPRDEDPARFAFGEAVALEGDVGVSEPDLAALPDGTLLACGVPRGSESQMLLWRRPPGGAFEPMEHPQGDGAIDCAWGVDAGGLAYYATSAGGSITLATTRDGSAWETETSLGAGAAAYDRPWIAGGEAGRALLVAYHGARGILAWSTEDAGATWTEPAVATSDPAFQTFGNAVWLGGDAYAFAYGRLGPSGVGIAPRDVVLARTDDAGRTWTHVDIAQGRGNINNIFPWLAADDTGALLVAWAESGEGGRPVVIHVARSDDGGATWSETTPLHAGGRTGLMPRVQATPHGFVVAYYATEADVQPSFDASSWNVVAARERDGAWEETLVAEAIHEGSVATGGYGAIVDQFARNPGKLGTANSQELLHNLGAALLPDGTVALAWASTSDGATRVEVATGVR